MDIGRFSGSTGGTEQTSHQRIAGYVKGLVEPYRGMGFTPREEWVVERTMDALRQLLADVSCSDEERATIEEFLALATEPLPGPPA